MDRGAAVNVGTPEGESVFDLARRFSEPEMERYLAAKARAAFFHYNSVESCM